jgi:hypothetical protein
MHYPKPGVPDPGPSTGFANEYKHEANYNKGNEKHVQKQHCIRGQQEECR